jgi:hypothetical protein
MCAAPAWRKASEAACSDAPLVITSSTSTTRRSTQFMGAQGLHRKHPLHVAQALGAFEFALRRRVAGAQQQAGVGAPRCQVLRQQQRLVETALGQALTGQRHGQHPVRLLQRRLDPGGAAHHGGQRARPAGLTRELELGHAVRPGPAVRHRRQADIQRRRLLQAGAALVDVRRHRQGAGGAARHRLRKARHARVAHHLRRPGMTDGAAGGQAARSPLDQRSEHGINILPRLRLPWPAHPP